MVYVLGGLDSTSRRKAFQQKWIIVLASWDQALRNAMPDINHSHCPCEAESSQFCRLGPISASQVPRAMREKGGPLGSLALNGALIPARFSQG